MNKKFSKTDDKFSKGILEKKQWTCWKSISQLKTMGKSITNKLYQEDRKITGIEERPWKYYIQTAIKKKRSKHDHNFHKLWNMIASKSTNKWSRGRS
jgi:hypothetical protein